MYFPNFGKDNSQKEPKTTNCHYVSKTKHKAYILTP